MKPLVLKAKNFCSLGDVTLNLADRGLVLILGNNKDGGKADSNGSGKSLLFDAFCWCLWGSTVRGIKSDKVVSRTAKKNCVVSVEFEDEGKLYKVVRHQADKNHIKANDLEFFIGGKDITSNSIAETQEIINSVVGMDFSTFRSMQPGAGLKAAELTDKNIKELLEGILQTETLSAAQKLANEKVKELVLQIRGLQNSLALNTNNLEAQLATIEEYRRKHNTFQTDILDSVEKAKETLTQLLKNVVEDENTLKKEAKKHVKFKSLEEEYRLLCDLTKKTEACLKDIDKEYGDKLTNLSILHREYINKNGSFTNSIKNLEGVGGTCSACNQVVDKAHVEKEIILLEHKIQKTSSDILTIQKNILTVEQGHKADKQELLDKFKPHEQRKKELETELRNKPLPLSVLESALARSKKAYEDQEKRIHELMQMESPFESLIEGATAKIEELEKEISNLRRDIDSVMKEKEVYEFWVDGFSPKGLRSQMLKFVTPVLNDRAQKYSQILTDGEMNITFETETTLKNGTTKEDFNITVNQRNGSDSYAGCSGGEKAKADLAIALTLGDLAGFRASKKVPLRFIDEAFERVDETGLDAIVRLLHSQSSQYESVFVVTHKSELKQLFDKAITVTKENGISSVED